MMKCKKLTAGMLSMALVFSSVTGICKPEKMAEAAVTSTLPTLSGLYMAEYFEWEDDKVKTDTDAAGNTVLVNGDGEQIRYQDQDNPEYLTKGISEGWGQGIDNNDEKWFDYVADGKVTHVNPSELTVTHLDGTPCNDITISAKENDPRLAVFHVNALERVKITYQGAEVNNSFIGEFELRSGFYTSETMSLASQITNDVNVVNGKSKDMYLHLTDSWEEAGFRMEPESAVTVRYWDEDVQKDVELSGADAKEYVTLTPVSDTDSHHLVYKVTVQGKNTVGEEFELILRFTKYDKNNASDSWEEDRRVNISIVEGNMLYAADEDALTVKNGRYTYGENAHFSSGGWHAAGSTTSSVYMLFQYTDADGALSAVTDLSKLTFYRSDYDEAQDKDVFTKADAGELKVEKAYADSNLVKVSYTGGPIEFNNEYVVTFDGKEPSTDEHRRIVIAFGSAVLGEVGTYASAAVSDAGYAKEFHTDGMTDLDIYAAAVDVSDRVFWNKVESVSLKEITLTDEKGNDLSVKVKTDKNVTITEGTGRTAIYGEKVTIPKGILQSSAKLRLNFDIKSTGGDGNKHEYDARLSAYIFYSEPVITSIGGADVSGIAESYTYAGKEIKPECKVTLSGKALTLGTDYTVAYSANKDAGTAKVVVTGIGYYNEQKTVTFTIAKAKNPITLQVSQKSYSRKKDLTKKKSFSIGAKKAQGTVTYTLDKKAKKAKLRVSGKGKVTIPKNCKAGSYTITVKAKGNGNYLSGKKTVTIKVK